MEIIELIVLWCGQEGDYPKISVSGFWDVSKNLEGFVWIRWLNEIEAEVSGMVVGELSINPLKLASK